MENKKDNISENVDEIESKDTQSDVVDSLDSTDSLDSVDSINTPPEVEQDTPKESAEEQALSDKAQNSKDNAQDPTDEQIEKAGTTVVEENGVEEEKNTQEEVIPGTASVSVTTNVDELSNEEKFVELTEEQIQTQSTQEDNAETTQNAVSQEVTEIESTEAKSTEAESEKAEVAESESGEAESTEVESEKTEQADADNTTEQMAGVEGELVPHEKDKATAKKDKKSLVKKDKKFKAFVKKYKVALIIILAVLLVAAAGLVTYFVMTKDLVFVKSSEDIINATKGKILVFKSDITVDEDIKIENYSFDLNKYTFTVNGVLTLEGDSAINIGDKKRKEYTSGGIVVADAITINGKAINLYSKTIADTLTIKTQDVQLYGEIQPRNEEGSLVSISNNSATAKFYSKLKGNLNLASNVTLDFYGIANQLLGGKLITAYNDSVAEVIIDTLKVVLYPNSKVDNLVNVIDFVYIEYLQAPTLLTQKEEDKFVCYISKVKNADFYNYAIDGQTGQIDASESYFELPNLSPGKYTLTVTAGSTNESYSSLNATSTIEVQYTVKLSKPTISVSVSDNSVFLNISSVVNATEYIYSINGKEYAPTADNVVDITDKVRDTGSYTILVYAQNKNDSSYELSSKALANYTKTVTLIMGEVSVTYDEIEDMYTASWSAVDNANYYQINNNGIITYTRYTTFTFAEDESITIVAKGTGFYEDSTPVVITAIKEH